MGASVRIIRRTDAPIHSGWGGGAERPRAGHLRGGSLLADSGAASGRAWITGTTGLAAQARARKSFSSWASVIGASPSAARHCRIPLATILNPARSRARDTAASWGRGMSCENDRQRWSRWKARNGIAVTQAPSWCGRPSRTGSSWTSYGTWRRDRHWTPVPARDATQCGWPAPGQALDAGAGEGRNAVCLAARGWQVTAVDFSAVGLDKSRRLAGARGVAVDWVRADVRDYQPEPGSFQLVLVAYLQLRAAELDGVLRRAVTALAPGGVLLGRGSRRDQPD